MTQYGFNKTIDSEGSLRLIAIESEAESCYVSGFDKQEGLLQNVVVAALDTLGGVKWWTEVNDSTSHLTIGEGARIYIGKNTIVVPFIYFNRPSIGLAFINKLGTQIAIREYSRPSGSVTSPLDIIRTQDGYLITGWTSDPSDGNLDGFAMKVDNSGEEVWSKRYGFPQYEESFLNITQVNGQYVLSGVRYLNNSTPPYSNGLVIAIDGKGSVVWQWEADPDERPNNSVMAIRYDSSANAWRYFSTVSKPVFIDELGFEVVMEMPMFVTRDSELSLISYDSFEPYALRHHFESATQTSDGNFVAAGNFSCVTENSPSNCDIGYGRVVKVTPDGSLIWSVMDTAFYSHDSGSKCYLSGITEASGGSIFSVGWAMTYDQSNVYRSFGWILKITPDGCIDTLCQTSAVNTIQPSSPVIIVSPNPARETINIKSTKQLYGCVITLYNLNGTSVLNHRLHLDENTLELPESLPAGLYIWKVTENKGQVLDVGKVVVKR